MNLEVYHNPNAPSDTQFSVLVKPLGFALHFNSQATLQEVVEDAALLVRRLHPFSRAANLSWASREVETVESD